MGDLPKKKKDKPDYREALRQIIHGTKTIAIDDLYVAAQLAIIDDLSGCGKSRVVALWKKMMPGKPIPVHKQVLPANDVRTGFPNSVPARPPIRLKRGKGKKLTDSTGMAWDRRTTEFKCQNCVRKSNGVYFWGPYGQLVCERCVEITNA